MRAMFWSSPVKNSSELVYKNRNLDNTVNLNNFVNLDKLISQNSFIEPYINTTKSLEQMYTLFIQALKNEHVKRYMGYFVDMYSHPSVQMKLDDKIRAMDIFKTDLISNNKSFFNMKGLNWLFLFASVLFFYNLGMDYAYFYLSVGT